MQTTVGTSGRCSNAVASVNMQAMQREQVLLYAAACLALREVKRVLRRISKDETTPEERAERKRLAGIAAKAAHANPLSALDTGVAQASSLQH